MTFEDRLAELGVDLSDLPEHERILILGIHRAIFEWKGELIDREVDFYRYIQHLTDVIDRMETRLVNVTGERDWLQTKCCAHCAWTEDGPGACDNCDIGDGVPEDWRAEA